MNPGGYQPTPPDPGPVPDEYEILGWLVAGEEPSFRLPQSFPSKDEATKFLLGRVPEFGAGWVETKSGGFVRADAIARLEPVYAG